MVELGDDVVLLPGAGRHARARQRPGPDRLGGLRHGHRGRGRGRRHHDRRHAAQQPPADGRPGRAGGQAQPRPPGAATSTWASGAARSPATARSSARCTTPGCSASSASCCRSGVEEFPPLGPAELEADLDIVAALGSQLIVHAEDPHVIERAPDPAGRGLRDVPAVPARGGGGPGHRAGARRWPGPDRRPGARPASVQRERARQIRAARGRGGPGHGRDLPALPGASRRGDPRRRDTVQVLPADPRRRPTGSAVARAGRRHDRLCGVRPLALHAGPEAARRPATSARRGAGSRRCSSGCPRCGRRRGRAGCGLDQVVAVDGAAPGGDRRAGPEGRDRAGPDADFCVLRAG